MVKGMTSCRPPEDDCVSRQGAIDAVCNAGCGSGFCGVECDEVLALRNMPSAQPDLSGYSDRLWKAAYERGKAEAQRTGKWIFPYGDRKYKKCSACERVYYSIPHDSNYCPNCGCRMTEEKA